MRMVLTERELDASRRLKEQLEGMTFDEALHALANARGIICLQRSEKADALTFHLLKLKGIENAKALNQVEFFAIGCHALLLGKEGKF